VLFDKSLTIDSIPADATPVAGVREKYVILGLFASGGQGQPPARQLAARLAKENNIVVTAAIAPSPALVPLRFRSRRLWRETKAAVDQTIETPFTAIIYSAGLGFEAIDKPRWCNRRMEEWRRIKLTLTIANRAKECVLLPDPKTPRWVFVLITTLVCIANWRRAGNFRASEATQDLLKRRVAGCTSMPPGRDNIVRICGITDGESGLARNALMSAKAFALAGIPTSMTDHVTTRRLKRPLTLHHANADQIPHQMRAPDKSLHIGFLLWELETLPASHLQAGNMLDEVWVPSRYVQKIYEKTYNCPVVNIGKGFSLPDVRASNMVDYNIEANHHVLLMCFDTHSSVERKNPLAAVHAFLAAFPTDLNVRLIIKTTPIDQSHWGDPNGQMHKIRAIAHRDPRVIMDGRMLPFYDLLALIKRADCIVSSHRAEGFGYIPAYALWYARPVIVTDYSGTRDFCNDDTAYPVAYKMVNARIGETIAPLKNAQWAEIDVDALANAMREVRENPLKAQTKALHGQKLLKSKFSPQMQAKRYLDRLKALGVLAD